MKRKPKNQSSPANQASGAGRNGNVPPPEHRFKPGQSGNPDGRPNAGATLAEWINQLAAQDLTEAELRKVARDPKSSIVRRAAAERLLRTIERGDLADMEPLLTGQTTLQGLRDQGINTEVIKKIKVKTRNLMENGEFAGTEVEREVELHDRDGKDFDRVVETTNGKNARLDAGKATENVMLIDDLSEEK